MIYQVDDMPKPDPTLNRLSQFKITEKNNFYVVREQDLTAEMQEWMQKAGYNVAILRESVGEKNGQKTWNISN